MSFFLQRSKYEHQIFLICNQYDLIKSKLIFDEHQIFFFGGGGVGLIYIV